MNDIKDLSCWYCEKKWNCKWQGFALHHGIAWGIIPPKTNIWRQWHEQNCGGKLIQLIPGPELGQEDSDEPV